MHKDQSRQCLHVGKWFTLMLLGKHANSNPSYSGLGRDAETRLRVEPLNFDNDIELQSHLQHRSNAVIWRR